MRMWLSTKPLISTWLKYDDNMQVSLDENAVREWMREFGKKYDTVGTTRTITTPNGKTAEVSGVHTDGLLTKIRKQRL